MEIHTAELKKLAKPGVCLSLALETRWPRGFCCPACGASGWKLKGRDIFECRACGIQTSVTAGTLLHGSHVAIQSWVVAAYLMSWPEANDAGANRIRSTDMKREIQVSSDQTLWKIKTAIRQAMFKAELPDGSKAASGEFEVLKLTVGARSMMVGAVIAENLNGRRKIHLTELISQAREDKVNLVRSITGTGSIISVSEDHRRLDALKQAARAAGLRFVSVPVSRLHSGLVLQRLEKWIKATSQKLHPELRQDVIAEFAFRENHRTHREGFQKLLATMLSPTDQP